MATKSRAKEKARRARRQAAARADVTTESAAEAAPSAKAAKKTDTSSGRRLGRGRKNRATSGRATPKAGRHTPPVSKKVKTSPRWMGLAIVGSFVLGVLVVILDYADLLPGGVNNAWLLGAIAFIFAGLLLATRYR